MADYPGFVGGSYTSQSRIAAADRTVNWYPEKVEAGTGKAQYVLYPAPGTSVFCTLPQSPVRCVYALNGTGYAIGGDSLYRLPLFAGGDPVLLAAGLHNPDDAPADIAGNGDAGFQLLIASGSRKYSFDLKTNTLALQAGTASTVGFMDGFGLALDPNRSELSISALEDFSAWDPTDVAQRDDSADKWIAMLVRQKDLWLFGSQTCVPWYNTGGTPADGNFPFAPNPSVFASQGIGAPRSAVLVSGTPIWLGAGTSGGAIVYRAQGFQPVRISTHAVEYALSTYSTLVDARAWGYQDQGHDFYVLTFPGVATWVYDATVGLWHERGDWNGYAYTGVSYDGHCYLGGRHLTGSMTTGAIYELRTDIATGPDGGGLRRLRRAPHMNTDGLLTVYDKFQVDFESGLGLPVGQGSNPEIQGSWSNDGSKTFGAERTVLAGKVGAYLTRGIWRQTGPSRDRVFQVTCSDPIPWRLIGASVDVRVGLS